MQADPFDGQITLKSKAMENYNRELFISPELRAHIESQMPPKQNVLPIFEWSDDGFITITKPDPRQSSHPTQFENTSNAWKEKK